MTTGTLNTTYQVQAEININGKADTNQWSGALYEGTNMEIAEQRYDVMRNANPQQAYRLVMVHEHVCRHGKGRVYE